MPLFDEKEFFQSEFRSLVYENVSFSDIEFEDCEFIDCNFSGTHFRRCRFNECRFINCNLSVTNFSTSQLFAIEFNESKLVGVDFYSIDWPQYHADFELKFKHSTLSDSSFFGLTLQQLYCNTCKLDGVDFREGNFAGSTWTDCDFTGALFGRTNLSKVDFSDSCNYDIDVLSNEVKGAKFSRIEALNLLSGLGVELVD